MKIYRWTLILISIIFLNGCYTFSSLQSAKLLVKGKYEITPSYSNISFSEDGNTEKMTDNFGVQAGFGVTDKFNLRFRYENIKPEFPEADSYSFLAIEPKISIEKDIIAFSVPVGFFTGPSIDDDESVQIHPSLHFTLFSNKISN